MKLIDKVTEEDLIRLKTQRGKLVDTWCPSDINKDWLSYEFKPNECRDYNCDTCWTQEIGED